MLIRKSSTGNGYGMLQAPTAAFPGAPPRGTCRGACLKNRFGYPQRLPSLAHFSASSLSTSPKAPGEAGRAGVACRVHRAFAGINRDGRLACRQCGLYLLVDVGELGIVIGMIATLAGLAIGLQTIAERTQQLADHTVAVI
jgi:hypothetical protein